MWRGGGAITSPSAALAFVNAIPSPFVRTEGGQRLTFCSSGQKLRGTGVPIPAKGIGGRLQTARFASFSSFLETDADAFGLLTGPAIRLRRGDVLRVEGAPKPDVYRLRDGWLACSVMTAEGRRQITKFHLPGDLVGMPSLAAHEATETIEALSDAEVEIVPLDAFADVFTNHPRVAALLFMWSLEERVRLMHHLAVIGRMRANKRVAALLLLLYQRAQLNAPSRRTSFTMPLTQQDLADATGMSIVHANRSLKDLRERGLVTVVDGLVRFHSLRALTAYAEAPTVSKRRTDWI